MKQRILVAEPSRTLGTLIRLTLVPAGFDVDVALDGRAALAAVRRQAPDLLVTDMRLPSLDGYALTEAVRREPGLKAMPVLLTMAEHERADDARLAHLDVAGVLTKPFERHALLERVRSALEQAGAGAGEGGGEGEETAPWPAEPAVAPGGLEARLRESLAAELPGLVERAVAEALPRLVAEQLTDVLTEIATPMMAQAVDAAVARALPDVLEHAAFGLGPQVEAALKETLPELIRPRMDEVVWKVVPELAESLIREELERLTEENSE